MNIENIPQTYFTNTNLVLRDETTEIVKYDPEFELILLSILGKYEPYVQNRIHMEDYTGTYLGDYGTYRKVTIYPFKSANVYEITIFMNIFMHEIRESTMMQIMKSHPLASRFSYHNNRLVEAVKIQNNVRFNILKFDLEELKGEDFELTLIGLVNLLFGDTTFEKRELLE